MIRPLLLASFASLLSGGIITSTLAAPGPIAETPLFLTNYPQANIFFMLDDSGSMDWEIMVPGNGGRFASNQPDGRNLDASGPIQQRVTAHSGSGDCTSGGWNGTYLYGVEFGSNTYGDDDTDCNTADDQAWRFRNNAFNPLYFDPGKHYDPWYGTNSYGQTYQDVSISNAPDNPYLFNFTSPPGTSETIDLTLHTSNRAGETSRDTSIGNGFFFYTWNDANSDGNFDNGEETAYRIASVTQSDIDAAGWSNLDGSIKTVAQLQQDFANWFSYYRKREYVAKRAISQLIYEGRARVGMSTLHNHNNVGVPVKDIDNISTPVSATADANKTDLLQRLAQINSNNHTPLRLGLRNVGNYFDMGTSSNVDDLFGGTSHDSPILSAHDGGSCQQNFTILMSDGFWNGGSPDVGNTDAGTGPWDGASYADTLSNTLADVAMKYYETDLASGLPDDVPITAGVDENNAQHLVTFTVAFGIDGTLSANPTDVNAAFTWPDPTDTEDAERIDDMRHAAWNARGQFLSARRPGELVDALGAAIKDIEKRSGSAAAVSFNSTSLQTDTRVFQAKFDSGGWHGDLRALDLNILLSAGTGGLLWEAANRLDSRNIVAQPRAIITYNGASGIPLDFPSDYTTTPTTGELTGAQVEDLLFNAPYPLTTTDNDEVAANQAFGNAIVDYLRGHHDNEGSGSDDFRLRNNHRLGDIVHSGPIYVGPPSTPYPDDIESTSNLYSTWAQSSAMQNRLGRVYVGSNGGMLHVLDSETGDEVFAYVPGLVYSDQDGEGLHQLAERGYAHDYYVDLTPTVADVFHDGAWKTLLIGGLRGGGKGIFVLDITQPTALTEGGAASVVLDEFTHADLGYTFSEIQVGRLNNGKWAAIFGNGFNNTGSGRAKLFIYYFDGTTPDIIDTEVGGIDNTDNNPSCNNPNSNCNGLSTPELVDLNGDGNMDRAYAGDLRGNIWAFDLTLEDTDSDGLGDLWNPRSAYPVTGGTPQPLFIACADTGCNTRQPITSKPSVARHIEQRAQATEPNLMVFFGTGQYLTSGDNARTDLQRFYGVWDSGIANLNMGHLTAQVIDTTTPVINTGGESIRVRTLSSNPVDYSAVKGWRIDLPVSKERMVVTPIALGDIVFFNTMIPSTDTCSQGGTGWLMSVDQLTGGQPEFPVVDLNHNGVFDDLAGSSIPGGVATDGIPTESRFLPTAGDAIRVTTDSSGKIIPDPVQLQVTPPPGRMSWSDLK